MTAAYTKFSPTGDLGGKKGFATNSSTDLRLATTTLYSGKIEPMTSTSRNSWTSSRVPALIGRGLLHEFLVRIRRICMTEMTAQKMNRTADHALEYPTRNFSNPWKKMPYSSVNVPYPGPPRVSV